MATKLEEGLGYTFSNKALLENALTHSSYANENREKHLPDNERLEFLGDSILGFVVADYLYIECPSKEAADDLMASENFYVNAEKVSDTVIRVVIAGKDMEDTLTTYVGLNVMKDRSLAEKDAIYNRTVVYKVLCKVNPLIKTLD